MLCSIIVGQHGYMLLYHDILILKRRCANEPIQIIGNPITLTTALPKY